jgi:signal transduction histidine kinase
MAKAADKDYRLTLVVGLLLTAVFAADLRLNRAISLAGGLAYVYVAVILVSLGSPRRHYTLLIALCASGLTLAGHFLIPYATENYVAPTGEAAWVGPVNRFLSLFAIWVTTFLSLKRKWAEEERARMMRRIAARERLALLGEMAAGVAHEFRNPLHGVLNCVEMLRKSVGEEASNRELLDLMDEGLRRMDDISSRLLRLGRDDEDQKVPTQVGQVVNNTVSLVKIRAQKDGIEMNAKVEPSLPLVPMDPSRISEALLNFLTNALDASGPGGRVEVRAQRHPERANVVEIQVADTGPGIPPEMRKRIFEPFFTTKPVGKGAGLGLTIARAIAENHGGVIQVADAPGGGTRVSLLLPALTATAARAIRDRKTAP